MTTRILIIDDEPRWIEFAKADLGATFEVEVANDLEATLAKLEEIGYDLIIASSCRLDVLKSVSETYPRMRVVVATGQPTTREAINVYRLGVLDYFAKDFRVEVLIKKIYKVLQIPVIIPA